MLQFVAENFRRDLPLISSISSSLLFQNKRVKYLNLPCAFDTETTSIYTNEGHEKMAFVYIWQFGFFYKGKHHVYYARSIDEFIVLLETLQDRYHLTATKRLIIYVHNFAFDFQFIRKYIEWVDVFSTKERVPIKALSKYGIEFRDSYILSAMSLAKVGDNLQTYPVKKLVGELDYNKIRTSETELTEKELSYCENDIKVLCAYIQEQIEQYGGKITKVPLTNTGRVRDFIRNKCYHTNKNHRKDSAGHFQTYKKLMDMLKLDRVTYGFLKKTFTGGFTHANYNYVGMLLKDVHSIDFTSSYPYTMLSEKFPMSEPKKETVNYDGFIKLLNSDKGLMFSCAFYNLQCTDENEMYISEYKAMETKNPIVNNGRIQFAEFLTLNVTDIDFRIISRVYTWDKIEIANVYSFYMDYLPKPILAGILELYGKKTTLKGVEGKEVEYLVSKGMLNSCYGMCVTDIVRDEVIYSDDWEIQKADIEEQIKKYNEKTKRFLYYAWGVWVTAYARRNLWEGILSMGCDYVYSDTDSIKFLNLDDHKEWIDSYNDNVARKLKRMCDYYNFDFNLCKPKTIKGKEKLIGVWDYEGKYTYFKTLGAKRYLTYIEGKGFQLTCAGLSKQNGMKYLQQNSNVKQVFDKFTNHMYIPADFTGKMTHTYIDDERESLVTDYQGNTSLIKALSGVHLEPCEFTLEESKRYLDFLEKFAKGYIIKEMQV